MSESITSPDIVERLEGNTYIEGYYGATKDIIHWYVVKGKSSNNVTYFGTIKPTLQMIGKV